MVIWYVLNFLIFKYYVIFIYFQEAVSALLAVSVLYVEIEINITKYSKIQQLTIQQFNNNVCNTQDKILLTLSNRGSVKKV